MAAGCTPPVVPPVRWFRSDRCCWSVIVPVVAGGSGVADTDFRSLYRPILDLRDKLDLQLAVVGIGLHRFYKRG